MNRKAGKTRPQLVCILADNSGSMYGPKAEAATAGIQEMLMYCQTIGPRGGDRSYFRFVLIRFGSTAEVDRPSHMKPVREIDPDSISIEGTGGGTNMVQALEIACSGLTDYMHRELAGHSERSEHPLPLVLLFSDGFNNAPGDPMAAANRIKALNLDGQGITIACAGVATQADDQPDEQLLRRIASPDCYLHIQDARMLRSFLAEAGSSGASSPTEVAAVIKRIKYASLATPPPRDEPAWQPPAQANSDNVAWSYDEPGIPPDENSGQPNVLRIEHRGQGTGAWNA
jgi:uncharacterized protein YegL